jgi:hypothetical protein
MNRTLLRCEKRLLIWLGCGYNRQSLSSGPIGAKTAKLTGFGIGKPFALLKRFAWLRAVNEHGH